MANGKNMPSVYLNGKALRGWKFNVKFPFKSVQIGFH